MKTEQVKTSFRVETDVRDRLKAYCEKEGMIMGKLLSKIINEWLDSQTDKLG